MLARTLSLLVPLALTTGCATDDGSATDADIDAVLSLSGDVDRGEVVFAKSCGQSLCHGSEGTDPLSESADLSSAIPQLSDKQVVAQVVFGDVYMPALLVRPEIGKTAPGYLTKQEIADVLTYLRFKFP